jgi:glucose/arabinose dehydrogenase
MRIARCEIAAFGHSDTREWQRHRGGEVQPDGTVKSWEPFITGFIQGKDYIGRPVDVLVMKDGSLLIADDFAGARSIG